MVNNGFWLQGATCEQDVNECSVLAGTDLGCQNGATCVNQPGTYQYVHTQCQTAERPNLKGMGLGGLGPTP